jgi:hypothetical protein
MNSSNNEDETGSINEDKDNDYFVVKEKLKKSQSRTHLLQVNMLSYVVCIRSTHVKISQLLMLPNKMCSQQACSELVNKL